MITASIEINRTPGDVFVYLAQLGRHREWQDAIVASRQEPGGPTRVGTRNIETRRVPGGTREFISEVLEYDPPHRMVAIGVHGNVRPNLSIAIHPIDDGARSRVILSLGIEGRGVGKLFALLARRASRQSVPQDLVRLKECLERGI